MLNRALLATRAAPKHIARPTLLPVLLSRSYLPRASRRCCALSCTPTRTASLSTLAHESATATTEHIAHDHNAQSVFSVKTRSLARRRALPLACPGCGAFSQEEDKHEAGYYSRRRKSVQDYVVDLSGAAATHVVPELAPATVLQIVSEPMSQAPLCDRCHNLVHHNTGQPIAHPSLADLEDTICESPHKINHVWHVVDAADFPMSLVMDLDKRLSLAYLRSRNRRSKDIKFSRGRQANMNFIITRSDLLAPKKEMVDSMVPKLRNILRSALGRHGEQARLGNVHVVSADRGWWTKQVKEKLLQERGAHWLVGKVNVGKSKLFETIFPKGTNKSNAATTHTTSPDSMSVLSSTLDKASINLKTEQEEKLDDTFSILPPPQPTKQYPVMPIASNLPGTTVSPIRVPYLDGRAELIDLPGLRRASLEEFVQLEHRNSLVMTDRVVPERIVIKPGKSLLLGGLVRITPAPGCPIILAHAFTPLSTHLTSDAKAEAMHTGSLYAAGVENIALEEAQDKMQSAGVFELSDDVTRAYAGPLTRRDAVGMHPDNLPFKILATDILIEGVGWIELQAQVRRAKSSKVEQQLASMQHESPTSWGAAPESLPKHVPQLPAVEIFSPQGKFIGQRPSLCAFLNGGPKPRPKTTRPRQSMVSVKNQRKPQPP